MYEKRKKQHFSIKAKDNYEKIYQKIYSKTEMNSNQSKNNTNDSNFVSEHLGRIVFSMFEILRKSIKINVPGQSIYGVLLY